MERYQDQILENVHVYSIAKKLRRYKVIPETLHHRIHYKQITESEAREELFIHLQSHADSNAIHCLCGVMVDQNDYPHMKRLGEDMKNDPALPPSGKSHCSYYHICSNSFL